MLGGPEKELDQGPFQLQLLCGFCEPVESPGRSRVRELRPMGKPCWSSLPEGLRLVDRTSAGAVPEGCIPCEGPHADVGKVREGRSSRGRVLGTNHSSCSPWPCTATQAGGGGRGIMNSGVKLKRNEGGLGRRAILFLVGEKLNESSPSQVCVGKLSPYLYLKPYAFSSSFLPPVLLRRRSERSAGRAPGSQSMLVHHKTKQQQEQ